MATSTTRQRKLERAKHERRMARQAEQLRRGRQVKAAVAGTLAVLVVVFGSLWLFGVFDKKVTPPEAAKECTWNPQSVDGNGSLKNVGTPATTGIPNTGTSAMTVSLGTGSVNIELDRATAKCGTASLTFLANSGYYNGTKCHEIKDGALNCGDHSETGNGGAAYTWFPENPPLTPEPAPSASAAPAAVRYPKGTVAMKSGVNGSQFLIFFEDSKTTADYSIVGKVTSGLDVVAKIASAGTVDNGAGVKTKPKDPVTVQSINVVDAGSQPAPTPSAPVVTPSASTPVSPKPSASK